MLNSRNLFGLKNMKRKDKEKGYLRVLYLKTKKCLIIFDCLFGKDLIIFSYFTSYEYLLINENQI